MKMREAYKQKMAAQLNELDAEINLYEARLANVGADIRIKYEKDLQALRSKRHAASEKMNELGNASGNAWESVKETADELWNDLKTGIAEAHAKFK
ncbi:MAG: hypothetical protein COS35_10840 [Zetaproteobacteria bacterium CG02_land_8_20_14_3_00_50_9]|nr:MAG: hypothetical protein COW62_10465 [Zetaproteobacteria bacterium CG17_big_fil_post_rev_8_21_14_2_50_50_13]PIV29657.1 MAG: hypothetical protein COS35_10840 [Zetaproteobacteria bacterium CG02_land_8_20_14_3_00_50_9]